MQVFRCSSTTMRNYKEQFIKLYEQLIFVHYPEKINQGLLTNADFKKSVDKMIKYVEEQEGIVFVALEDDVLFGYAHGYVRCFLDEKRMMLDGLVVDAKKRKHNIGRALLREFEKYAKENFCDVVELFVTTNNPDAVSFYREYGFVDSRLHMIKKL